MYGLSMQTIHIINRMDADIERRAVYRPELRKSAAMYRKRQNEKKQLEQLYNRIHNVGKWKPLPIDVCKLR